MNSQGQTRKAAGFTIVELMIATMVFSVVLLIVTAGILQVARVYYKGITELNTQNTARGVMDTIAQSIQFSGGDVLPTPASPTAGVDYFFCAGDAQFSYRLGWQVENELDLTKHRTWHGLVRDTSGGCSGLSSAQNLGLETVDGSDLLGQHMRLAKLVVEPIPDTDKYRIQVRVVYGDDDLLNNPTESDASCKAVSAGTQFCAVSELSTVVVKRVE